MAERKSIVLYLDSEQQWDMLTDAQAGILIKALLHYSKTGERIHTDDGMVAMAFSFMAAQIDRDGEKYDRVCERNAKNGLKGGRPRKADGFEETQKTQSVFEKPKKADNNTNNDNNTDNDTDTSIIPAKPRARFVPPTVEEVRAYCEKRQNGIDPESFVDFYTSKGWMIGKTKMKDWQAAVREWERRRKQEQPKKPDRNVGRSSIDMAEVEKLINQF